ncbi:PREDICTED: nuclear distribution protein nudE-like 1 isoform X2 [Ceratosolen solmsi marchali]|nr:PREDICTED: nuclear distribution protein nudE-like 1 isoform X2 [Ceratosolen solmsi marchali]
MFILSFKLFQSNVMEINPLLKFVSKDDEIQYWMNVANQMYQRKEDAEQELQEYQVHSQLLERELETSFNQSDRRNCELHKINYKLTVDNEDLKNRLDEQIQIYSTLQSDVQNLKIYNENLLNRIRKLEQNNDDLERFNREKTVSGEELESQFNMTLEKLAFLETEVDEIESLKCIVQRLQEENRDLRQQIQVEHQQRNMNIQEDTENGYSQLVCSALQSDNKKYIINNEQIDEQEGQEGKVMPCDILKYVRELEQTIECSQQVHSATKASEEKLKCRLNTAIKKIASLENALNEKDGYTTNTIRRMKDEKRDMSQDVDVRLRRHKDKNIDKNPRPRSDSNKDDIQRNSNSSRLGRHIENRVKKVKEEEKRQQNLVWFLKRWRYSHLNWLRKREQ